MARSGKLTNSNGACIVEFEWQQDSRNIPQNKSNVLYVVYVTALYQTYSNVSISCNVQANSISHPSGNQTMTLRRGAKTQIAWGDLSVPHNDVGDASVDINVTVSADSFGAPTVTGKLNLNNIVRMARITSIPTTIYDEDSKISVSYNVSDAWDDTEVIDDIELKVTYDNILSIMEYPLEYRNSAEVGIYSVVRDTLWEGTTDRTEGIVTFEMKTIHTNGNVYTHTKTATYKIINAHPSADIEVVTEDMKSYRLTGNDTTLIKGISNVSIGLTATPKKKATIVDRVIYNGAQVFDGQGTLYSVTDNTFFATVTDSRGLTANAELAMPMIEYIPLTCNLSVDIPSATGETTVNVSGNCFYGSFGAVTNSVKVYYRYAQTGNALGSWRTATAYLGEDNVYYATAAVTGLDYTKQYTFEAYAVDEINTVYSLEAKVKAVPVFDWGENDFNFNVPVTFNSGFTVPASAMQELWNGELQFNGADTVINLATPVSELQNGLVLIFIPKISDTVAWYDMAMSFFISKKAVQVMPNGLHTFLLMSGSNFDYIGSKSLYITDTQIKGNPNNGNSGTKNGIAFNNANFVLRYVLGV